MELTAALMALRWFAARGIIEPVQLLCDSQYVVKGCNEWRHGWKKKGWRRGQTKALANADLWQDLDEALRLVPIKLEWVKAHIGTVGNERADELAAIGREEAMGEATGDYPTAEYREVMRACRLFQRRMRARLARLSPPLTLR